MPHRVTSSKTPIVIIIAMTLPRDNDDMTTCFSKQRVLIKYTKTFVDQMTMN